jgi:hypothetical protein
VHGVSTGGWLRVHVPPSLPSGHRPADDVNVNDGGAGDDEHHDDDNDHRDDDHHSDA